MPRAQGDAWFCGECAGSLERNATRTRCPRCSLDPAVRTCACEFAWDQPFDRVHSLFSYDDSLRAIMQRIKYRGAGQLARDLGARFGRCVPSEILDGAAALVPVPLHRTRRLSRGYNQAEMLAIGIASALGPTSPVLIPDMLVRRKRTRTQTKLGRDQRRANLAGAFAINPLHAPAIHERPVVLVDDVVTTGATTASCTHALLAAGASAVHVVALARD